MMDKRLIICFCGLVVSISGNPARGIVRQDSQNLQQKQQQQLPQKPRVRRNQFGDTSTEKNLPITKSEKKGKMISTYTAI